jgi:methyltransferase (TIGR00027 family)
MKANTASRTAQLMALSRALETRRPRSRRLFTDPYAIQFLDSRYRFLCRLSSFPPAEKLMYRIFQKRAPGALSSGLARTRYIDDLLEQTIRDGARQVIILGAGFDTRSLRLDYLRNIPVIEIDHPDTARMKLNILHALPAINNTRYLQVDLNTQDLNDFFTGERIDRTIPTTIIWEGVTNYLQQEAVNKTFAVAGQFAKGSSVIFTYIDKQVLEEPAAFHGAGKLLQDLAEIEERWTFGFDPEELSGYLSRFGLQLIENTPANSYRKKYLPERKSILPGYEFYRVAIARKMLPAGPA